MGLHLKLSQLLEDSLPDGGCILDLRLSVRSDLCNAQDRHLRGPMLNLYEQVAIF